MNADERCVKRKNPDPQIFKETSRLFHKHTNIGNNQASTSG